jgi:hypothetical protein
MYVINPRHYFAILCPNLKDLDDMEQEWEDQWRATQVQAKTYEHQYASEGDEYASAPTIENGYDQEGEVQQSEQRSPSENDNEQLMHMDLFYGRENQGLVEGRYSVQGDES